MAIKIKNGNNGSALKGILIVVLIVVMLAASIFVIFDAIIGFITDVAEGIVNGTLDFLAHPFKTTITTLNKLHNLVASQTNQKFIGEGLELEQKPQLVIISQADFDKIVADFEQSISRDIAGLDNVMLKKILLTYNMGNFSENADIIIELSENEYNAAKEDSTLYKPFEICKGEDIEQFELPSNLVEGSVGALKLVTNAVLDFIKR